MVYLQVTGWVPKCLKVGDYSYHSIQGICTTLLEMNPSYLCKFGSRNRNTTKEDICSPCEYSRCLLRQAAPEAGPPPRQAASAQLPAARRSPGTPEPVF
jgi:hypothetical protein